MRRGYASFYDVQTVIAWDLQKQGHLCPKESFCSSVTIETTVYLLIFNGGYGKLTEVVEHMGCSSSAQLERNLMLLDAEKMYHKKR